MKIHRKALVTRHNIVHTGFDFRAPLSVGNGQFAFTADVTGLQTFPSYYRRQQPLCTLSEWGWHSFPMPEFLKGKEFQYEMLPAGDRVVPYHTSSDGQEPLFDYLRRNPHRFHLGMIGFRFMKETKPEDIKDIHQELDLYTGMLHSRFTVHGAPVEVFTCSAYDCDAIGVKIKSPLLKHGNLRVKFDFPYAANSFGIETNAAAAEFSLCDGNRVELFDAADGFTKLRRQMDDTEYFVDIRHSDDLVLYQPNVYELTCFGQELEFTVRFTKENLGKFMLRFDQIRQSSADSLQHFWETGGMIDFCQCSDPRAQALEDRMIKSLYITRINSCSNLPPCESGFTCNSNWYGKSHLEMHYWHSAFFALWGRPEFLEKSLNYYLTRLDACATLAKRQGYKGIRIPKFVDPDFVDTPSSISPLLLWQQPHPTMLAELIYRVKPQREILERYFELVERSCEFMLDILVYDKEHDVYNLDSPMIPAQEIHDRSITKNPVYELEYFHFALTVYRQWCLRLDKKPLPDLDEKLEKLAKTPIINGLYPAHQNCPETFEKFNDDHPSMLCAYGVLPGWRMEESVVRATLDKVMEVWHWEHTWGWDYALLSMCASKLGEPELAVDILLKDSVKNTYSANGHVYQYPGLPCYIDTNASLLLALGFLASGCDSRPGCLFPKDWKVLVEGMYCYI